MAWLYVNALYNCNSSFRFMNYEVLYIKMYLQTDNV